MRVLEALKAQTLSTNNWELLVVDNASKDPVFRELIIYLGTQTLVTSAKRIWG